MAKKPSQEDLKKAAKQVYHHIDCSFLKGLTIELDNFGRRHKDQFSILALSSKETIRTGLRAVDKSPFKTIFVVNEKTGKAGFALTQNEEYVAHARKRKKPPLPPPPPPPKSFACIQCELSGGTCGEPYPDGSIICWGGGTVGGGGWDDELEVLMP